MAKPELVNLAGSSFVIPGPTNIGLITRGAEAYLIDSGNDKEAGRKILRLCEEKGLAIRAIISTHSNADHIGGNEYIQTATGCKIYASEGEKPLIEAPGLEASLLWGGMPGAELDNKFFRAAPSRVTEPIEDYCALASEGIGFFPLPGHFLDMIGIMTNDKVFYVADSLFGPKVLEKHRIPFIYDVAAYKDSIRKVRATEADYYVMSHGDVERDIGAVADANLGLVERIEESILDILGDEVNFEVVLKDLCGRFGVELGYGSYALVGSTTRSFLSYLAKEKKIAYRFKEGEMLWKAPADSP